MWRNNVLYYQRNWFLLSSSGICGLYNCYIGLDILRVIFFKKNFIDKTKLIVYDCIRHLFFDVNVKVGFCFIFVDSQTPYKKECLLFGYNLVCIHQHHQGPRLLEDDNIICCQMLFWVLQQIFYGNR